MCENLFDGVSQPVNVCEWCGVEFEGEGRFCSAQCEQDKQDDDEDD